MTHNPALGGPQPGHDEIADRINASYPLNPWDLIDLGQKRLKDPNLPIYDPSNISRPVGAPSPAGLPDPTTRQYLWQNIKIADGGNMTQNPVVAALQGPSDPVISALFAHPAQHLQKMAGEVVPFPIDPRIADMRRMRHEDFMQDLQQRLGQPGLDQYRTMWPAAPIELGPGAAK